MIPSINPLVLNLKESATRSINMEVKRLRREGKDVFPRLAKGCDHLGKYLESLG